MGRKKTGLLAALAVVLLALCVAGVYAYRMYYDRKLPNFTGSQDFYIYPEIKCIRI